MSWPLVKLGDVAPAKPSKNAFSKSEEVWTLNLDQVEADTGKVLGKIMAPVSEAGTSTHGFDERHVLYSKLRPYLNKVVLPDGRGLATTELVPMLPDPSRLDRKYLAYYLRSKSFVDWVSSQVAGAKMPRVSMQLFWQHEIPLPPLPEQKRIAAILDKADAIRRKRQQAIQLADDFLRAVFLDMFGDPVTNSKGWGVRALSNLIDESRGVSYGVVQRGEQADEGIPLVRISDIATNEFRSEDVVKCSKSISDQYRRTILHGGELLISIRGTVGRVAEVPSMAAGWNISREVAVIPILSGVSSSFLKWLLLSSPIQRSLAGQIKGVAQSGINLVDLRKLPVICPPAAVIEDFEFAERKIREKYILCAEKINGNELFSSLSQKAFAGLL